MTITATPTYPWAVNGDIANSPVHLEGTGAERDAETARYFCLHVACTVGDNHAAWIDHDLTPSLNWLRHNVDDDVVIPGVTLTGDFRGGDAWDNWTTDAGPGRQRVALHIYMQAPNAEQALAAGRVIAEVIYECEHHEWDVSLAAVWSEILPR